MSGSIATLLTTLTGVKQDFKQDWKEDAKADWKVDYKTTPTFIADTPPSIVTGPVITGTAKVGQTLSINTGTWAGTTPMSFTYQWTHGGQIIDGATGNSYVPNPLDVGYRIDCYVTATNVDGKGRASSQLATAAVVA